MSNDSFHCGVVVFFTDLVLRSTFSLRCASSTATSQYGSLVVPSLASRPRASITCTVTRPTSAACCVVISRRRDHAVGGAPRWTVRRRSSCGGGDRRQRRRRRPATATTTPRRRPRWRPTWSARHAATAASACANATLSEMRISPCATFSALSRRTSSKYHSLGTLFVDAHVADIGDRQQHLAEKLRLEHVLVAHLESQLQRGRINVKLELTPPTVAWRSSSAPWSSSAPSPCRVESSTATSQNGSLVGPSLASRLRASCTVTVSLPREWLGRRRHL
jgi:hypothetical protein